MRLASYVPGELIPLPLSGSIPELPHVEKVENAANAKILAKACSLLISPENAFFKRRRRSLKDFVQVDVVRRV